MTRGPRISLARCRPAAPLLAAVLVLAACTAAPSSGQGADGGPGATSSPGTTLTAPSAGPGDVGTGSAEPSPTEPSPAEPKPAQSNPAEPSPEESASSGRSDGQSGAEGSELAPPESQGRAPGDDLGDSTGPAAGRLSRSPETGSSAGLLPGFPDDVVLVPADAAVSSSSVTGADGRYQVTLDVTVDSACSDVLLDYRAWFTSGGFAESGATTRPGRTTVDLERADGTVVLEAAPADAACDVTVLAALSAR